MKPVDDGIFTYHAASFPVELRGSTSSIPGNMLRALEEARRVLDNFSAFRATTIADKRLSPTGKREALREWTETHLPALRSRVEEIGDKASANEAGVIKAILSDVLDRSPDDVADAMIAQEVRSYFRTMPDDLARSDALRRMAGDRSVLRALLGAPAFLSGVSEDDLERVRVEAGRNADPDRWARMETLRQGWAATEKAVAAAVRAVEEALAEPAQATGDRILPEPDPENRERVMEALRRPENAERLGL